MIFCINNNWYNLFYGQASVGGLEIDGVEYYFDSNGVWRTGWIFDRNHWFYYYQNGGKAKDTFIDGYYLDENGEWIEDYGRTKQYCEYGNEIY